MSVATLPYYPKTYEEKKRIDFLTLYGYMMGGFECEYIPDVRDVAAEAFTTIFNLYNFELETEIIKKKVSDKLSYNQTELTNGIMIISRLYFDIFNFCYELGFRFTKDKKKCDIIYTEEMLEEYGKEKLKKKMIKDVEKILAQLGISKGDKK